MMTTLLALCLAIAPASRHFGEIVAGYVQGDLDHDGDVDQSDFGVLQLHLGEPAMPITECDLNRDGWVDQKDVDVFMTFERKAK